MALFDKKDIQNSFVNVVSDELMDTWGWDNDAEYKALVMEIDGVKLLYDQILEDMKKEDDEYAKRKAEADGGE